MQEIKNIKLTILNGEASLSEEKKEKLKKALEKMLPELLENVLPDWMTVHKRFVLFTREKKISELTRLEERYEAYFSEDFIQIKIGWDDVSIKIENDTAEVSLKKEVIIKLLSNWQDIINSLSSEKKNSLDEEYKINEELDKFLKE